MKIRVPEVVVRGAGVPLVRTMAGTWRMRARNDERFHQAANGDQPFVFLLWHEALLPLLWWHRRRRIAIVVSDGLEGRYLSDFARRIGYDLVPGSSSRGGARALLRAIRTLEDGTPVAFASDGPVGPRREIKPGVVRAAQRAGVAILPVHAVTDSAWQVRSWDRMLVPKPFAKVEVGYGSPFVVDPGPAGLEAGLVKCATALTELESEMAS